MRVHFSSNGWNDFLYWAQEDLNIQKRLLALIQDARRDPFRGIGKPEPLKGELAGLWSRRITGEHRLIYAVEGRGEDQRIVVTQCRFHY